MQLGAAARVSTSLVVLLVAIALLACLFPLLVYLGARQRKAVMAYAQAQGWTYRDLDPQLATRYRTRPFVTDTDARAEAVITGAYRRVPFAAYAYTFQLASSNDSGKERSTTCTIPVVSMLLMSELPDLDVVPKINLDGKWGEQSSFAVVPASAQFGGVFLVRSADQAFAAAVLNERLLHSLMAFPDRAWAFRGGDLLSIGSWNGKPEKIPSYLDHLGMILDAVPASVWDTFGGPPRPSGGIDGDPDQPNSSST